jgi:hypothetical protein
MKAKYIYKNKITGEKIYSEVKLADVNLILVAQVRNGMIKSGDKVIKK